MARAPHVVFLIIDALPPRHVTPSVMPTLAALAVEGGSSTGRAVMTSATYPNHATFATGVDPLVHGIVANWIVVGGKPTPSYRVGPATPTIFDACRAAGRSSVAVLGDQNLVGVMGARAADDHWPPDGVLPDDVVRDAHDYAANSEVVPRLQRVLEGGGTWPDLLVGHLNEPDTAAHVFGPDSEGAIAAYRAADAAVATLVAALRPRWDDVALIVVSDHDQEDVDPEPIDLYPAAAATGLPLVPIPEGTAAIVWGDDASSGAWLDAVDGVAGHRALRPNVRLVWSEPRRWFSPPAAFVTGPPDRGTHGGVRTRAQVAVVAGGHAAARSLASDVGSRPQIDAAEWAPAVARMLAMDWNPSSSAPASPSEPNT